MKYYLEQLEHGTLHTNLNNRLQTFFLMKTGIVITVITTERTTKIWYLEVVPNF